AFQPETQRQFSIYDWILVSAIVEAAAGEPFLAFMNREVLARSGMERTVPDGDEVPDRAAFYFPRAAQQTALGLQDAPQADYSCFAGSGGFVSTPSDLARFGQAMVQARLLKPETFAILQKPVWLDSSSSTAYALGWNIDRVQRDGTSTRMVFYRGTSSG